MRPNLIIRSLLLLLLLSFFSAPLHAADSKDRDELKKELERKVEDFLDLEWSDSSEEFEIWPFLSYRIRQIEFHNNKATYMNYKKDNPLRQLPYFPYPFFSSFVELSLKNSRLGADVARVRITLTPIKREGARLSELHKVSELDTFWVYESNKWYYDNWDSLGTMTGIFGTDVQMLGEIKIICKPETEIYLNGELKGVTNKKDRGMLITDLEAGTYKIKAVNPEYGTSYKKVILKEHDDTVTSRRISIHFKDRSIFERSKATDILPGIIEVYCNAASDVYIDGESKGSTSKSFKMLKITDIAPGTHEVKIVRKGYPPVVRTVNILKSGSGTRKRVTINSQVRSSTGVVGDGTLDEEEDEVDNEPSKNIFRHKAIIRGNTVNGGSTSGSSDTLNDNEGSSSKSEKRRSLFGRSIDSAEEVDDSEEKEEVEEKDDTKNRLQKMRDRFGRGNR